MAHHDHHRTTESEHGTHLSVVDATCLGAGPTEYVDALIVKRHALPDGMDPLIWSFINMGIGNFIGIKVLAEDDAGPEQMDKIRQTLRILLQSGLEKRTQD